MPVRDLRFVSGLLAAVLVGVITGGTHVARAQEAPKPSQYTYLEGHKTAVYAVGYTPDGKTILSGSIDGTINAWDATTGQLIRSIRENAGPVLSLAITRDNLRFAAAGIDRKVRLFDVPSTQPIAVIPSVPGVGLSVAVSGDGRLLFSGDASRTLRLWNVDNNAAIRDYAGSTGEIVGIVVMPETRGVLAASRDGGLRSWNIDSAAAGPVVTLPSANSLSADVNGTKLAVAGEDGVVRLVSWPAALPANFSSHGDQIMSVAVSGDGQWILSGGLDSALVIAKGADGTSPRGLPGQPGKVYSTALSPDGLLVASGSDTGIVKFWNALDAADRSQIGGHVGVIYGVSFHPTKPLVATAGADSTVRVFRVPAPARQLPGHTAALQVVAVTQDGAVAATAAADKSIRLYKTADGGAIRAIEALPQPATALGFSADGKRLAFGDAAGNIRIENAADGKDVISLGAHFAAVSGVAFHPDGKRLVTAGQDGSLKVWTIPAAVTVPVATHPEVPAAVALSADGKLVLSGSNDSQVRLTDTTKDKDKQSRVLEGKLGPISSVGLSSDGLIAAAADNAGLIRLWSTADGADKLSVAGHTGGVHSLQFAPGMLAQFATAGADGTTRIWRLPTAPVDLAAHKKTVQAAAVSGDGKLALTGGADGLAQLWTLADNKAGKVLAGSEVAVHSVALKKDANEAATGDAAGIVRFYNPVDGMLRGAIGAHDGIVTGVAIHPTQPLAASVGADGAAKIWQLPLVPTAELGKHAEAVTALVLTSDGATAITASTDKTIKAHVSGGVRQLGANLPTGARALAISADNAWIAAGTETGEVRLINVADGAARATYVGHTGGTTGVSINPAGTLVASVGADGVLRVWETATVAPVSLAGHSKPATASALSPNGQWLATAAGDNTVRLWNATNNQPGPVLSGHTAAVTSVSWKADSAQLVTGSADKSVRVWNAADGKQLAQLDGSEGAVNAVAITPDGTKVLAGGADKSIRIWTVADMTVASTLAGHTGEITGLALVANGATLISASADGTVRTWTTADGKPALNVNTGSPVAALAVSVDEKLIAAAGADKNVRLLNTVDGQAGTNPTIAAGAAATGVSFSRDNLRVAIAAGEAVQVWTTAGKLVETFSVEKVAATTVAFGADPRTLYVGGSDNAARVVKLAMARMTPVSAMPLNSVTFTPDGNGIITGGADKTVKFWNMADLAAVRAYDGVTDAVTSVAITKDGQKVIAASSDKSVRVWPVAAPQPALTFAHPAAVRSIQPSADNLRLVTGADDNAVRVIDLVTGKLVQQFAEATKPVTAVAFAADGKTIVSGSADFGVRRVTLAVKAIVPVAHEGGATCVTFNHDGANLVTGGADKFVKLFDLNGAPVRQYPTEAPVQSVAVRNDGLQITAGCQNAHIYLFTFANAALERKIPLPGAATSVSYSIDNLRLAVACADKTLRVFQPVDGLPLETVTTPDAATSIAFGADNGTVLAAYPDNAARVHSLSLVRHFTGHTGAVTAVAWMSDGLSVFTGGADKAIFQWNLQTGMQIRPFAGHTDAIAGLGVSADGARLISASPDKTLRTWTIANGAAATSIALPVPARTLSVSADGNRAVATADDNILRVWDLVGSREVEHILGHEGGTTRVALSGDGKTVASTGADKNVRAWNISADVVVPADPMKLHDLALLADGSHIVSGGEDKIVKLWDLKGTLVRSFGGLTAPVKNVAVSQDGMFIAAGGDPLYTAPLLHVWRLADAGVVYNQPLVSPITTLNFSGDGKLAIGSTDKHVRVYSPVDNLMLEDSIYAPVFFDLAFLPDNSTFVGAGNDNFGYTASTSLVRLLKGHAGIVRNAIFVPGTEHLISAGDDKTIRQWDLTEGKQVRSYAGAQAAVVSLAVSKDGKLLAAGGGEIGVRTYAIPAADDAMAEVNAAMTFTHPAAVNGVSLTADGTRLATAGNDGHSRLWDTKTGKELERLMGAGGAINTIAFSQDGKFVVTGGGDRIGRRWSPAVTSAIPAHEMRIAEAKLTPDGTRVFTASADNTVGEFEIGTGKLVRKYEGATLPLRSVAPTPDGKYVVAGGEDKSVRVWSTADGSAVAASETPDIVTQILATAGAKKIVAAGNDKNVRNFSLAEVEGKPALELVQEGVGHTAPINGVALAADEHTLFTVSADQTMRKWNAASYGSLATLEGHTGPVYTLDFSPDNKLLASAGADKTVRVWTTADGKPAFTSKGHTRQVNAVAFSPSGKELASAGLDATIRLWNSVIPEPPKEGAAPAKPDPKGAEGAKPPEPGDLIGEITEDVDGPIYTLLWTRDGNSLLSAGAAKTWQSWLRKDLKPGKTFIGHNQTIYRIQYNPAGTRFATLDNSGQFMVWNVADGALLYHQQLPAGTAWCFSYAPTGLEIAVGTSDPRVIKVALPPAAQ